MPLTFSADVDMLLRPDKYSMDSYSPGSQSHLSNANGIMITKVSDDNCVDAGWTCKNWILNDQKSPQTTTPPYEWKVTSKFAKQCPPNKRKAKDYLKARFKEIPNTPNTHDCYERKKTDNDPVLTANQVNNGIDPHLVCCYNSK